jgi:hypothetical protein
MYVLTYVCTYVRMYVCVCMYACVYLCMCVYLYMCMYVCTYAWIYLCVLCMYACMCVYICVHYIYMCVQTRAIRMTHDTVPYNVLINNSPPRCVSRLSASGHDDRPMITGTGRGGRPDFCECSGDLARNTFAGDHSYDITIIIIIVIIIIVVASSSTDWTQQFPDGPIAVRTVTVTVAWQPHHVFHRTGYRTDYCSVSSWSYRFSWFRATCPFEVIHKKGDFEYIV